MTNERNNLLHHFEVGIELALSNGDTHSVNDGNRDGSMIEMTISELLNDKTIPQQFKMAFQQQTKLGWEQLFMGKMACEWRQC